MSWRDSLRRLVQLDNIQHTPKQKGLLGMDFGTREFERRVAITAVISAALALMTGAAAMVISIG